MHETSCYLCRAGREQLLNRVCALLCSAMSSGITCKCITSDPFHLECWLPVAYFHFSCYGGRAVPAAVPSHLRELRSQQAKQQECDPLCSPERCWGQDLLDDEVHFLIFLNSTCAFFSAYHIIQCVSGDGFTQKVFFIRRLLVFPVIATSIQGV